MPVIWWKLITVFLLFALFTTTTTTDDASFMPIPTVLGNQSAHRNHPESETETESVSAPEPLPESWTKAKPQSLPQPAQSQTTTHQYHQYQSLNHQQQSFKVQRSPDGKLNLVFNHPLVSLQNSQQQPQLTRPEPATQPRRPPNDSKYRPSTLNQCADGFNQSRSFCTNVNNYPDLSGVKSILSRNFANFFINEQVDQPDIQALNTRLGISTDEQYLCKSHVRILYPKLGQKLDSSWQLIVNTDEFKQGILIEECDNEGSPCDFLDSFPNNYKPVCKQHYVVRHLVTINNATLGQPEVANEPFKIPSCCKCVVKSSFSANIGA
ncbi:protein spaetzle isoform X2 [Drosophila busckii]|uniref:protein spaetzle isoform X2 n=1 Tax=Drosophila busckii TaxID=30019 RepID=UPI00083F314A|nr:protein spaetzle isoform X2 [Drosophila busckii]